MFRLTAKILFKYNQSIEQPLLGRGSLCLRRARVKKVYFLLFISLFFVASLSLRSFTAFGSELAASRWIQLGGPYGGNVIAIVYNGENSNEIWAALATNPSQIFRTTNGGGNWRRVAIFEGVVYDLAIHPTNPSILYALGDSYFYKSANRGKTWAKFPFGINSYGRSGRIAIHRNQPDIIYVSGYRYYDPKNWKRCMAVLKSVNGGQNWAYTNIITTSLEGVLNCIAISPSNANIIYSGGYYLDRSYQRKYRVFKSANGGNSWTNITGPINIYPRSIVIHPANPNQVFVATDWNVWRSSNGGSSWKKNNGWVHSYSLAIDPSNPDILYAGYYKEIFKSINGGVDWTVSFKGLYGDVYCFSLLPDKILCGTIAGIFKSVNSGLSWAATSIGMKAADVPVLAIAPSSPNVLYSEARFDGFFKSTNSGQNWKRLPNFNGSEFVKRIIIHPDNANTLFVLAKFNGNDLISKSLDGGKTWTVILEGNCKDLEVSKNDLNKLFIAGQMLIGSNSYLALHKSIDGGNTWTHHQVSSLPGSRGDAVAVDPTDDNIIYIGGDIGGSAGMFKSINGGANWNKITGAITGTIVDVAVNPKMPNRVYVASYGGIYKSDNGGDSWSKTSNDSCINCFLFHPTAPNIVYAGGDNGVFVSQNSGNTWSSFDEGLLIKAVKWLDINKVSKILFAGTAGGSIWKRAL